MIRVQARATDAPQRCGCGCGAAITGWSNAGRASGARRGVRRVYRAAHGACHTCGQARDQYRQCEECDA